MRESNFDYSFYCSARYTEADLIREYYEVYVVGVIRFLKKYFSEHEIKGILSDSLAKSCQQFAEDLDQIIDRKDSVNNESNNVKTILCVLHRMLTGNLTRESTLIASLSKATRIKNIEILNALVKQHITLSLLLPELKSSDQNLQ